MKWIGDMSVLSGEDFGQGPTKKGGAKHGVAERRVARVESEGVRAERKLEEAKA